MEKKTVLHFFCLFVFLTVVFFCGIKPEDAKAASQAEGNGKGPSGVYNYILVKKGSAEAYLLKHRGISVNVSSVKGITYDRGTNTITINNVRQPGWMIETNEMGVDLKLKVIGNCELGKIVINGCRYGGSLTVIGTGSLTLNANRANKNSVILSAEMSQGILNVEKTVAFKAYGSAGNPAILAHNTLVKNAIRINGLSTDAVKSYKSYEYLYKTKEAVIPDNARSKLILLNRTDGRKYSESSGIYAYSCWEDDGWGTKYVTHLVKTVNISGIGNTAYIYKKNVNLANENLMVRRDNRGAAVKTDASYVIAFAAKEQFYACKDKKGKEIYIKKDAKITDHESGRIATDHYTVVTKFITSNYGTFAIVKSYTDSEFDIKKYSEIYTKKIPRYRVETKNSIVTSKRSSVISGSCGTKAGWSIDLSKGLLSITGNGAVRDFKSLSATPWYMYIDEIKKVNIASGITKIGQNSFFACQGLTEVTGCANVQTIGVNAFRSCSALRKVAGCSKVTSIGKWAFYNCTSLTQVGATAGQIRFAAVKTVGDNAFLECRKAALIDLGANLTSIGEAALKNTKELKSLYIRSSGLKTVGADAFKGLRAEAVTYVPRAKVAAYKNGVLKNKGEVLTIRAI